MQKLSELRKQKGDSQQEIADLLGVSRVAYARYEAGNRKPDYETLTKLADYFGTSVDYLLGRSDQDGSAPSGSHPISGAVWLNEKNRIPILGRVPAGTPIQAIEDIEGYVYIDDVTNSMGRIFALRVMGDSMKPEILEGDIAIVLQTCDVKVSGKIYVVRINGDDVTVKKVEKSERGLELIPLNPKYGHLSFTPEQVQALPIEIVGRVIEIRRKA